MSDQPTRSAEPIDALHTGSLADPAATTGGEIVPPSALPPVSSTRYVLGEEIARGGMGVVYRATDTLFGREVALKVLQERFGASSGAARRFAEEARITGQLQHPAIPPVHDIGTLPDGRPFLAMKLIRGRTLDDLLAERADPAADRGRFVAVFEAIAQAAAYAHDLSTIHRDLKPANVMVGDYGEVQVMDWGLAKILAGDPGAAASGPDAGQAPDDRPNRTTDYQADLSTVERTVAGYALGTPSYMPPEQAAGRLDEIDRRSDVFALGGVLCAILTGAPPYRGDTAAEVIRNAAAGELTDAAARLAASGADPELVSICRACLCPDPGGRLPDARAVAAAVANYRETVEKRLREQERRRAAAVARVEEQRKKRRVQRWLVGATVLLVVASSFGAVTVSLWRRAERNRAATETARNGEAEARGLAERERGEAVGAREAEATARATAERALGELAQAQAKLATSEYGRTMQVALRECEDNNIASARSLIASANPELRGWEWDYINRLCNPDLLTLRPGSIVVAVAWSHDGTRIATSDQDGGLRVWDATTGELRRTYPQVRNTFNVAWSPNGRFLAVVTGDGVAILLEQTGAILHRLPARGNAYVAGWSPNGEHVVTGNADRAVQVWNAHNGELVFTVSDHTAPIRSATWSPDGSKLLTAGEDGTARIFDGKTGQHLKTFDLHRRPLHSATWSPDGKEILTSGPGHQLQIWSVGNGQLLRSLPATGAAHSAWSPGGESIAVVGEDVRILDAKTGSLTHTFKGHTRLVWCLAWNPDGRRLLTGSWDGTARVWDAERQPKMSRNIQSELDNKRLFQGRGVLGPDRTRAAERPTPPDFVVRIRDVATGREIASLRGHTRGLFDVAWHPAGVRIATSSGDRTVRIWNTKDGELIATLPVEAERTYPTALAWSPDGKRLATGVENGTVLVWDANRFQQVGRFPGRGFVRSLNWDRVGERIVAAAEDGGVRICDTARQSQLTLRGHSGSAHQAVFSPDGRRLVSSGSDRQAKVWDVATGSELLSLKHTGAVQSASWVEDGARIVTVSTPPGGTVETIWDARPINREFRINNPYSGPRN